MTTQEQLNALSWKSGETGISYGKMVSTYSKVQLQEIYIEYEEMKMAQKAKMATATKNHLSASYDMKSEKGFRASNIFGSDSKNTKNNSLRTDTKRKRRNV